MTETVDRSYRGLLRVPNLGRVLVSMQIARIAQSMVGVALVLFTLDRFGSAPFAGVVIFASVFPGLLISPIAGALLDRHGRIRLVTLDYAVSLLAMIVIAVLAILGALPGPTGFTVSCLPVKIAGASAGWCRAVAVVDGA